MSYKVKLQTFEGPFDLLVYLIENAQMSIYDIEIKSITGQYLEYIKAMQEMDTAKRGEMVKEIDRMVLDDVANIPLFFNENIFGVRDSIEYTPRYDRYLLAWEISFK